MTTQRDELPDSVIIYDDDCGLCHNFVRFLLKIDRKGLFFYAPQGGTTAKRLFQDSKLEPDQIDSVFYIDRKNDSRIFYYSDAALQTFKRLGWPWKMLWFTSIVPRFLRDSIYKIIAKRRYRIFGKKETCLIDDLQKHKQRFLS